QRLYAGIPTDWYRNNPIAQYEGYFASVFYSHLASLGLPMVAEDTSLQGRLDLMLRAGSTVWLFEFKVMDGDAPTGEAPPSTAPHRRWKSSCKSAWNSAQAGARSWDGRWHEIHRSVARLLPPFPSKP
ncbi:MAG: hypothetical protein JG774_2076, partial [Desulfomicrobiaceae bacterium]|nr:hypothetical protein [Desulfomicrobiaceae bacterium]